MLAGTGVEAGEGVAVATGATATGAVTGMPSASTIFVIATPEDFSYEASSSTKVDPSGVSGIRTFRELSFAVS